jgi:hypothetical protein
MNQVATHFQPTETLTIVQSGQPVANDFLVPVESTDLVSSGTAIQFLSRNENVIQAYEPNFLGEKFLPPFSHVFF